ncbi:hypothetical protein VNI00_017202 [Paramarasmius palmivorus]|uniref:Transposase n=1 Tax=Paramarasmius palmivorus TaxID=297713 RepID=A0AAW0B7L4_9AGAR
MPKFKPTVYKSGDKKGQLHPNFLVKTTHQDEQGKPIYKRDGTLEKVKISMTGAHFADGTPQSLYYENGPDTGLFKGMANILIEWGYDAERMQNLKAQYFAGVKSLLEQACNKGGVKVWFLLKFHCELNPIEQCWGYTKSLYCLSTESSREDDLEKNTLAVLKAIQSLAPPLNSEM